MPPPKTNKSPAKTTASPGHSGQATIADDVRSELARIALAMIRRRNELDEKLALVHETFGERAAIREYLGGHDRRRAEHLAIVDACEVLGVKYLEG